ncbi:MAG TPA: hypothetical protein DD730_16270 [Desulfosporosinus sp.]|nr:hypothetical protein [Desulfosporosinus sp.]
MGIIVLLGLLIFVAWGIWLIINKIKKAIITTKSKSNISEMNKYFGMMKYFKMEKVQFSIGRNSIADECLAIDDHNKLICILEARNDFIKEKVYKYEVLNSSEIVENGEILLLVIFNDTSNSVYKFNFMAFGGDELSRNNSFYKKYREITRDWHGILSVIIERNEEERLIANGQHQTVPSNPY